MTLTQDRSDSRSDSARRAMIDSQLRTSGVNEPWVLDAMANVAREDFVPPAMRDAAYIDRAIPLGGGRMLAPPLVHARMLAEARPNKQDAALLIGDKDGYLATLLRPMVGSLDVIAPEAAKAGEAKGPYSLILIDGAIDEMPDTVAGQLADDGRVVTGVVRRGVTRLAVGRRAGGEVALLPLAEIGIPVLPEFAAPKRWSF